MIYLYDVIHYAHTRTSVPTSARTHKEKKNTRSRTHTVKYHSYLVAHAGLSTHIHTRAGIHTHVRGRHTHTHTHPQTHPHTQNNRCVNGDARLTKRVYMSMYARVHIQSTSRMCFTGLRIFLLFFLFFCCCFFSYFTLHNSF